VQGLIIGIVAIWVGLDQVLKFWTVANVPFGTVHPYEPFPAFMSLAHVRNTGAAWSLFSSATPVLIAVRVLVGAAILIWLLRKPRSKLESVAFAFIVAGAWGNAIDGIQYGFVVDMLQSHWLTAVYRIIQPDQIFPIFNLADTGVVGGVLLLIAHSFLPVKKELHTPVLEPLKTEIRVVDLNLEAPTVLELQRTAYQIEADLIGFQEIPALTETLEALQDSPETFLGFYKNNLLIGMVSYRFEQPTLDIHRLVVSPTHFRQGVARRLLQHLLEQKADAQRVLVQTSHLNAPALALYQSLGFTVAEELKLADNLTVVRLERSQPARPELTLEARDSEP
jgi:lipoprotein signal peptidase